MAPQLATLAEEPGGGEEAARARRKTGLHAALHRWARARIPLRFLSGGGGGGGVGGGGGGGRPSPDLRVLLSVLACPLSPVPVLPRHPRNVASSAQYILEQFRATTGCAKIEGAAKSMYAAGRVRMAMAPEPGGGIGIGGGGGGGHEGCFVVWQLVPDMWLVEMAVAGHAVAAGCDGRVAWRRTPWLDAHAARGGGARPLRRALQGLDPVTIASVFSAAEHVGEKAVDGEDCFALRLDVAPSVLSAWGDGAAEVIRHGMTGYFSQRSGLLARLDDSQLTRIQTPGAPAMYWETTVSSRLGDYRAADGAVVAHAGTSVAHLARFGADVGAARAVTRMEEAWTIDDVAFNVAGLCPESFIAPEEVRSGGGGGSSSRRYDGGGGAIAKKK
ncbi:uncharacterized protein [Oryza sativa Japonica Group]|uniref:uncharacterized protein n=1 Tax=Oryza sativa subsp. japonica TaxID=39947 RepID=UPI0007755924|nr:uncharacterized protein LOC4348604 [Oryza sativa Japonica Group]KAF2913546.1 hypothetical protein DAI22_10g093300 [Oryza sativa Japonica Group]